MMRERMMGGQLYRIDDALREDLRRARLLLERFNRTSIDEPDLRREILGELLGTAGEGIYIEPNFRCDYGANIHTGARFYANFDCVILDVCPVRIGDDVLFGPQVGVYAASHPIDASVRAEGLELGRPVTIGDRVWIGGHSVINGGVEIGPETIIGSGSVVTRSIPSGVIAAGNPCRVIREITDQDSEHWQRERRAFEEATGLC